VSYDDVKRMLALRVKRGDQVAVRDHELARTAGGAAGAHYETVTRTKVWLDGKLTIWTGGDAFTVPNGLLIVVRPQPKADPLADRLEYLRGKLRAERISYGELAELQGLASEIDPGDVELLEAAGVPEFPLADVLCWHCQAPAVRLTVDSGQSYVVGEGRCGDCPDEYPADEYDDAAEQLDDAVRFESRFGA